MERQWFEETEELLRQYWRRQLRIERLAARIEAVEVELRALQIELEEARCIPQYTAKYGVTPGGRKGDAGYEAHLEKCEEHVDRLSRLVLNRRRQLAKLKVRLLHLQREQAPVAVVMRRLTSKEYQLTELKYVYRRSNRVIGEQLSYSEGSIRNLHERVITQVAEWLGKKVV